ncbi:farnesol dehydrogenase-like [Photinus pyralis]|uniref:farnesol dehydrogenase-like n=1 Tax=Photinus pyralis TaxID=7054 RepID=UPI0012676583|nr:farnesol dehydrogenase-like [Photinus pyralis]
MERWHGKVAVVTGASSGIGAAVAEALVDNGCIVAGLARRKEKIEQIAARLHSKVGKLYALKADVGVEEDILTAFKWVQENLGPIHILVNSAGTGRPTNLIEGETTDFKCVLDTNVLGLTIATREAVKDMRKNNIDGYIVHINSVMGHRVFNLATENVYPASKHAITALTETLRNDLKRIGSKIKVSSVSPGLVDTEIFASNGFFKLKGVAEIIGMLPKIQSKDVADAILYLLGTPPHVEVTELTIQPTGGVS